MCRALDAAHVGLDNNSLNAMLKLEFGGKLFGRFRGIVGSVVEDKVAAFGRKILTYRCADA